VDELGAGAASSLGGSSSLPDLMREPLPCSGGTEGMEWQAGGNREDKAQEQ